jgi:sugar phosphate isomerase/epimerase
MPGRGNQGCAEALQHLAASGFDGVVVAEISTRRARFSGEREAWRAEALGFARRHLSRPLVAAHRP